jgi:Bacteriodetes cell division protein (FtsL-like)
MNTLKQEKQAVPETPLKKKKKGGAGKYIQRILNGDYLVKEGLVQHIPFIGFLVLLFILNIGLVYYFENTAREKKRLESRLNELRSQYNTTVSELETRKQQSNVAQSIEDMGLRELHAPPQIIDVEEGFFDQE